MHSITMLCEVILRVVNDALRRVRKHVNELHGWVKPSSEVAPTTLQPLLLIYGLLFSSTLPKMVFRFQFSRFHF